jgi:hypothetical protein
MRFWSAARSCYIDGESLNFTGPLAAISLIPGEGREQRYADLLSSRGGAKYGELPTGTEMGKTPPTVRARVDKTCACGSRMHWESTVCHACNTLKFKRALSSSIPELRQCACGRTIARTSRLARCVRCREQARRLGR